MTNTDPDVETVELLELPVASARALLATGVTVTLCVNPVEYHGPHLSLRNDRVVSIAFARALAARLETFGIPGPFVLAGDLEVGVDPAAGPGSRHTPYRTARELVLEACRALVELGARRVVLMTFHGSPMHNHAVDAGVQWLCAQGVAAFAPLNLAIDAMVARETEPFAPAFQHVEDPAERAAMLRDLPDDFHAGFFETSVALELAGETVAPSYTRLPPCPELAKPRAIVTLSRLLARSGRLKLAGELSVVAAGLGWMALRPYPGYTGRPHRATEEAGRFFVGVMLDRCSLAAKRIFLEGAAPSRPPFQWMKAVTLGGRAATPRVPLEAVSPLW